MAIERRRRTQEERAADTKLRLIEATISILAERGYARASTIDIADRAGVSRGALTHHFQNKDDLVVQAVEHLLGRSIAEIGEMATRVRAGEITLAEFVDYLWSLFSGQLFMVTLEHVTEARHNTLLKERLVPVVRRFHEALDEIWYGYFAATNLRTTEIDMAFNATLCLLRGMGVQTVLRDDPVYYRRLLEFWKKTLFDLAARPSTAVTLPHSQKVPDGD
jgi:AcrR family transcriptional regulator